VDVVSSDRHTVKPWFAGKLPFTFNPPDLSGTGYTLVGGRMMYLDGAPGAHLICDWQKHRMSILIFQDQGNMERLLPAREKAWRSRAFNVETWSNAGLRYFIVSDAAADDLNNLAEMWKRSNS
jgi:anti-sigma factor RsiW